MRGVARAKLRSGSHRGRWTGPDTPDRARRVVALGDADKPLRAKRVY